MPYNTVIIDAPGMVQRAGVKPGMTIADLGTGREGRMAVASAKVMGNTGTAYAVDIVKSILPTVGTKARLHGFTTVKPVWSNLEVYGATREIADNALDVGFLVTILFQSPKYKEIIRESIRMIKPGGRLVLCDWHPDATTPLGPEQSRRIHPDRIKEICTEYGMQLADEFEAGPYHWGLMFTR